ncbi:hypothetical protein LVO85_10335 [Ornithinimicrobium sp. EGI L100131]|nr:hypothetical protein [Ornithinimicrobium sediminis]
MPRLLDKGHEVRTTTHNPNKQGPWWSDEVETVAMDIKGIPRDVGRDPGILHLLLATQHQAVVPPGWRRASGISARSCSYCSR